MPELINDDLINNVSGGAGDSRISKDELLNEICKINEKISEETNPTTIMTLRAELMRLKMLYHSLR